MTQDYRKSITFIAPNLKGGGAERVISMLVSHCTQHPKFRVELILLEAVGPYLEDLPSTVKVIDFKCSKATYSLPKLIQYLRKSKPDIIFSSHMHISTIAIIAHRLSKVDTKLVIRQPTMLRPIHKKQTLSTRIRQKLFLNLALSSHKIIVSSKVMREEFITLSKIKNSEKVITIYNPLPIQKIKDKSRENIEHPWFIPGEPPVVLAVGRLVAVKDFKTLINAFKIVREKKESRLIILGEGPLRSKLQAQINELGLQESVDMLGFSNNPFKYMSHSKVFVLSSLWEGFPNCMVEAMACQTHIVATNCEGGTAEILDYGKLGKIVPVQDPLNMANAIVESLDLLPHDRYNTKLKEFLAENVFRQYYDVFSY